MFTWVMTTRIWTLTFKTRCSIVVEIVYYGSSKDFVDVTVRVIVIYS